MVGPRAPYRTIGAALARAPAGARVVVSPGTYRESVVLERPVELVAARPDDPVILESTGAPCLTMRASEARVRGITLRPAEENPTAYAVIIPQGRLRLEACEIAAGEEGCVRVSGAAASPALKECRLRGGDEQALLIEERAHVLLEGCTLSEAELGLRVGGQSEVTLRAAATWMRTTAEASCLPTRAGATWKSATCARTAAPAWRSATAPARC
jgi:hypothetical protein